MNGIKPDGTIRKFPLGVVLTVTTGKLLTTPKGGGNGIEDLYIILKHMTREDPYTHTLGRFSEECKPWLFRWYPELDAPELQVIQVGSLTLMLESAANRDVGSLIIGWLSGLVAKGLCSEHYDIGEIPQDDHERKCPFDELVAMRGTDEGIVLLDTDLNVIEDQ